MTQPPTTRVSIIRTQPENSPEKIPPIVSPQMAKFNNSFYNESVKEAKRPGYNSFNLICVEI